MSTDTAHLILRTPPLFNGLKVKRLPHAEGLPLPAYQSEGASGFDLCAAIPEFAKNRVNIPMLVPEGVPYIIPTGFCFEIPQGYELQIRPRSGLAAKYGVTIINSPGTIDSDYRGEIFIILYRVPYDGVPNHFGEKYAMHRPVYTSRLRENSGRLLPMEIWHGDRIAQAVLMPVAKMQIAEVAELSETVRGEGKFGSTGQ